VAAEIAGHASARAWARALRSAQRRHPLLSSHIDVGDDGLPRWHRGHP
jgi:hypothetical protein